MTILVDSNLPFLGSRAFNESEQSIFYGRAKHVDDVLSLLQKNRFITLTGPLGSGKSSFLNSGLIPALKRGQNGLAGKDWVICSTRPGLSPIRNLSYALAENNLLNPSVRPTPEQHLWIENKLKEGISGLESIYRQSEIFGKKNLMIVIDQFEDLFLNVGSPRGAATINEEVNQYINAITGANYADEIAVYVLIALGSEQIMEISPYRRLQDLLNQGQYLLPRIHGFDIKKLISLPIIQSGFKISSEGIDSIMNQFGSDMRYLPNLQFLLYKTWLGFSQQYSEDKTIDIYDIQSAGNLNDCFANHLENYYLSLQENQKIVLEKFFKALLATDVIGKLTKPQSIQYISSICETSISDITTLISPISTGEVVLLEVLPPDISLSRMNESKDFHRNSLVFLKNENAFLPWERFRHWLDSEKESRDIYKRLVSDENRYSEGKTSLLRPPDLDFIWKWYQDNNPSMVWGDNVAPHYEKAISYLKLSYTTYKNELQLKENARKREISRYRRNMFIGLIVGLIIVAVVSFFALMANEQRNQANEERKIAMDAKIRLEYEQKLLLQTKDSLDGVLTQKEILNNELLANQKTIMNQRENLISQNRKLEKSEVTIKNQNSTLVDKMKETEEARKQAVEATKKQVAATNIAQDMERYSDIKNKLFVLSTEISAAENPYPFISKLNDIITDYKEVTNKIFGEVLPNNVLFQALNLTKSKLEKARQVRSPFLKSNAGLRSVSVSSGNVLYGGDEGKLYENKTLKADIGQRIRTILPLKGNSGALIGTFDGNVFAALNGKSVNKMLNVSSNKMGISLLNSFQNGEYLFATQNEFVLFTLEKGTINKSLLKENLLTIQPILDRNEFLFSTNKGLYLWNPNGEIKPVIKYGNGEFTSLVTAISISDRRIAFGLKSGKILLYNSKSFFENPEKSPLVKFSYHKVEVTKILFYDGLMFSSSLDKTIQFVNTQLSDPASYVVKFSDSNSWIWDISIQKDKNGIEYLLCAEENGNLYKYFIRVDDELKWINELAKGN